MTRGRRAQLGAKGLRYSLVSVFNTVAGQVVLAAAFGVLHWSAYRSAFLATVVVAVPSFFLYRRWVWARDGSASVRREVLPFVVVTLAGLVVSTRAADASETLARHLTDSRSAQTLVVMAGTMASLVVLWVARFALFEVLFAGKSRPSPT